MRALVFFIFLAAQGSPELAAQLRSDSSAAAPDTLSLFVPPHTDPLPLAEAVSGVQRVPAPFAGYPGHG